MERKTTTKAKARSTNPTHVKAVVEERHYSTAGERLSPPPFTQYYTPQEWEQFKEDGPKLGLYLVEVLEAPKGVDTDYGLMSPKN